MRGRLRGADLGADRRARASARPSAPGRSSPRREAADATIALCAPTGRAARRLEEATGHEAQTIHRHARVDAGPRAGLQARPPAARRPGDRRRVLDAQPAPDRRCCSTGLAESTHVVFVGDADQLPPIGAGKPFEDLIASGIAPGRPPQPDLPPGGALDDHHRRPRDQRRPPAAPRARGRPGPRLLLHRPADPERALETVVEVVAERVPERFGVDPIRDVQVLAPMYRGAVGIDALNERLQERLNPDGEAALSGRFRIGDRLIQTRNSHELGLMNGSIVFLRDDDPEEEAIVVDTDDGGSLTIPYGETATLRLAYAISVHKAQGCEVPVVVGVCHRSHTRMLTRPLLYTAITRARSTCVLVGDRAALDAAVAPRRRRRPPLRAWPSACAARLRPGMDDPAGRRAAAGRDRRHPGGDRRSSPSWCSRPGAAPRLRSGAPRRHGRGPRRARRPRRRRAAADPRPRPDPRRRLLPGRDRRRRGRLRLRLLPGAGADDGRLAALRAASATPSAARSRGRCSTAGSAASASSGPRRRSSAAAPPC